MFFGTYEAVEGGAISNRCPGYLNFKIYLDWSEKGGLIIKSNLGQDATQEATMASHEDDPPSKGPIFTQ